jgi:hypothetical protein
LPRPLPPPYCSLNNVLAKVPPALRSGIRGAGQIPAVKTPRSNAERSNPWAAQEHVRFLGGGGAPMDDERFFQAPAQLPSPPLEILSLPPLEILSLPPLEILSLPPLEILHLPPPLSRDVPAPPRPCAPARHPPRPALRGPASARRAPRAVVRAALLFVKQLAPFCCAPV